MYFARGPMRSFALTILVCTLLIIPVFLSVTTTVGSETQISSEPTVSPSGGPMLHLTMLTFDPVGGLPDHITKSPTDYHIVQFDGPIQDGWKAELESRGVRLFGYVPDYGFIAHTPDLSVVWSAPHVRAVVPYAPGFKYQPDVCQDQERFNVWILEDRQLVADQLMTLGANVEPGFDPDHNIVFNADPNVLPEVANIPQVEFIEPMPEFRIMNSVADGVVGAKGVWTSLGLEW